MSGTLPPGACDTHCHVFGPQSRFAYAANRTYTPQEAPREALFALHRAHGLDRAVIVQPAVHGTDNRVTLDAIAASGNAYRGIALVPQDVTPAALDALHAGGIRGVRFNFLSHIAAPPPERTVQRIAELVAPLGWHILLHLTPADLGTAWNYMKPLAISFIVDYMARINTADGLDQPGFRLLLDIAADARCWVKISGADRASAAGAPFEDVLAFSRALLEAAPDRILWGTDWPHPNIKGPMPLESDLLALLRKAAPEPALLQQVLVDNPNRLYRFDVPLNT
ncbi:MAG TPA: amidohydrolase family protein [Rhizomicrobium sp.]